MTSNRVHVALYKTIETSHPDQADTIMWAVQNAVDVERELRRAIERLRRDLDDALLSLDNVYSLNSRGVVHGDGSNVDRLVALRCERWENLVVMGKLTGLDLVDGVTAILKAGA